MTMTTEERALLLHRREVIKVVSALRIYREAASRLLKGRYNDGYTDSVTLSDFERGCGEAEDLLVNDD